MRLEEIGSQLPSDIRQLSTQDIGLGYCISLPGVSPRATSFSVRDLEHITSLSFYFLICKTGMMTIRESSSLDCASVLWQQEEGKTCIPTELPNIQETVMP